MIQKMSHATIYVLDQDQAKDFYVQDERTRGICSVFISIWICGCSTQGKRAKDCG